MIEKFTHYFTKLEKLSSDELLHSAETLVVSESTSIAKLIAHLAEMSSRKTALKLGYSSLYQYSSGQNTRTPSGSVFCTFPKAA